MDLTLLHGDFRLKGLVLHSEARHLPSADVCCCGELAFGPLMLKL